jgi:hypothetical protein
LILYVFGFIANIMANCTKCGADITASGYETEELKLPNDVTGYLVSCKQCKTILGIVQEK